MQEPKSGEMYDPEVFRNAGESYQQTAARHGFPLWTVGEIVTLKGIDWTIKEIQPQDKVLVLKFHAKAKGIGAMMERLAGHNT